MKINRPVVGEPLEYNGHMIKVLFLGPDLLYEVDGIELSSFYMTAHAARDAGKQCCDDMQKEKEL